MTPPADAPRPRLHHTRLVGAIAALSLLLIALLGVVPWREDDRQWRSIQRSYNEAAAARGLEEIPIEIRQIVRHDGEAVDRCTTCHLGMGEAPPIPDSEVFGSHPPIAHGPRELGCTQCHAGNGRATTTEGAHGHDPEWTRPMLERKHFEAGCGTCHSHLPVMPTSVREAGQALFRERKCTACHAIDGEGSQLGPDLSRAGLAGFDPLWHDEHRDHVDEEEEGPWIDHFEPLLDEEIPPIEAFVRAQVGMPRLLEGKTLSCELGCRGCHRIAGVGGDTGPDLTDVGQRLLTDRSYSGIEDPRQLSDWLRRHFIDPAAVVVDSEMPALDITPSQADALTLYMMSLQGAEVPEAWVPRDRARGMHLEERDFATDGESLFVAFCSGCHGKDAEGRTFGRSIPHYPALTAPDFLGLVDDPTLVAMIERGRPGRRMPAFGDPERLLQGDEIERIVQFLRTLETPPPDYEAILFAPVDLAHAERLYADDCAACHGDDGEGTRLGPPLAAADNPVSRNPSAVFGTLTVGIAGTAMGSFRDHDARDLRALTDLLQLWPPREESRAAWSPADGTGSATDGARLYAEHCGYCHGADAEGDLGPALANDGLAASVSDALLVATIVRGRAGTDMPGFGISSPEAEALSDREVLDVVAYLRELAPAQPPSKSVGD